MFGIDDALMMTAGASLVSGLLGADASKSAANTQAAAADRATQAQIAAGAQARSDLTPFREGGVSALQRLMTLTGIGGGVNQNDPRYKSIYDGLISNADAAHQKQFGMSIFDQRSGLSAPGERARFDDNMRQQATQQFTSQYGDESKNDPQFGALTKPFDYSLADFYKDPSYNFQLQQGEQGINRAMAARGLSSSTPGLKALMQWNQDYAGTAYSGAFTRAFGVDQSNKQTTYNFLQGIAGMGQNSAAQTGSIGANTASGAASSLIAGGQAQAAGTLGAASSVNNAIQGGLGNYMYNQRYQQTMGLYGNLMNQNNYDPNFATDAGASLKRSG